MKFLFNSLLFLLVLFSFKNSAFSLSDNQINDICKKSKRRLKCINDLNFKNSNLLKGKRIEIPVIPFKK